MSASNYITKVAFVGAGGHSGRFMTEALLKTGRHVITALTRVGSVSQLPAGVAVRKVDYEGPLEDLADALRGHQVLVITLSGFTPPETEKQLVRAAGLAGVPYIMPSEWGCDTANEALCRDVIPFQSRVPIRKLINEVGCSYISMSTGFWYEWSLGMPPGFGFDLKRRRVTLFDEGETKISISTWPQVGRAVAAFLSLPIRSSSSSQACIEDYKNQVVYVSSFTASQRDMLASLLAATGTAEADWAIRREPARERYADGMREVREGNKLGFVKAMYTRIFFDDGAGNTEDKPTQLNRVLGLPADDDRVEATLAAIERNKQPQWYDTTDEEDEKFWKSRAVNH